MKTNNLTKMDRCFIREMKDRDLIIKYANNVNKQHNINIFECFKINRTALNRLSDYIGVTFTWDDSIEGGTFWLNLYKELILKKYKSL